MSSKTTSNNLGPAPEWHQRDLMQLISLRYAPTNFGVTDLIGSQFSEENWKPRRMRTSKLSHGFCWWPQCTLWTDATSRRPKCVWLMEGLHTLILRAHLSLIIFFQLSLLRIQPPSTTHSRTSGLVGSCSFICKLMQDQTLSDLFCSVRRDSEVRPASAWRHLVAQKLEHKLLPRSTFASTTWRLVPRKPNGQKQWR